MAHATELGMPGSISNFPDYFSGEAPNLVVQESLDIPGGIQEAEVPMLREKMTKALGDAAIMARLASMSDTANWLVPEVATEGASNGLRDGRQLLEVGYGVTEDGEFVEYFSDSSPHWEADPDRNNYGRGLELLRRAGVQFSYVQEPDSKTLFFTIKPDAEAVESDAVMFDLDSVEEI